jgi:uncharacterized protein (DUF1684 family)
MLRFVLPLFACGLCLPPAVRPAVPEEARSLAARIQQARAAKDSLLRHSPDSPLPAEARTGFGGLVYYPVDPRYHVAGELLRYGRAQVIQVPTNGGTQLAMEKHGRFRGILLGKPLELEVYRSTENGELVVLFKDRTNGGDTYGGGRYVPVSDLGNGHYLLDLNMAYNPYCAYSTEFACPLPPLQNHLAMPIKAGEKVPGPDLVH